MTSRINKYKNKKKSHSRVTLITIGLLFIILFASYLLFFNDNSTYVDNDSQKLLDSAYENKENVSFNVEEKQFQKMLHRMTHQKVIARSKHGILELSEKNIEGMLNILSQSEYEHSKLYEEILNKWKNKDFNNIVRDHNEIWRLLGKPDGKATRKISEDKERKLVKEIFKSTE